MKPLFLSAAVLLMSLLMAACTKPQDAVKPLPQISTRDDIGYFCGMIVQDHQGPKSQILLAGQERAVWFTSVRDGVAYTLLPEETAKISAFYVTAMDKTDWDHPEQQADAWIEAEAAWYVIDSSRKGGMGAAEAIPFSTEADARTFAGEYGGEAVSYPEIPPDYILGHGQVSSS